MSLYSWFEKKFARAGRWYNAFFEDSNESQYQRQLSLQQQQQQWETEMSNTAHQREMADLQKAGLNPLLTATGGSGASTPTSGMGQAEGSSAAAGSLAADFARIMNERKQINSNVNLQEKQALKAEAEANTQQTQADLNGALIVNKAIENAKNKKELDNWERKFYADLENKNSQTLNNYSSTSLMKSQQQKIQAEIGLMEAQKGLYNGQQENLKFERYLKYEQARFEKERSRQHNLWNLDTWGNFIEHLTGKEGNSFYSHSQKRQK